MSITTRTNLATNPSAGTTAANYAAVAGTGGTAALAWNGGAGYQGIPGYPRVTWSVATTAVSGGLTYTQTGLAASTLYSHQIWARSSKAQTLKLTADYYTSGMVYVNNAISAPVVLAANTWTRLSVTGASGAASDRVVLTVSATTGGTNWAVNDWLDGEAVLIETAATAGPYFDGSFVNAASTMYAWSGATNASTSTAKLYTPALALVAKPTFDPTPRVEITVTDLTPTANTVTIWRTADGKRQAVRGARKRSMVSADAIIDYEAPLGRLVSYEIEVTAGINAQVAAPQQTTRVDSVSGCIQDPLVPGSSVPVFGEFGPDGQAYLRDTAVKQLEYAADMSIMQVLGSPDPVALLGQRMSAAGVDMSMSTRAAQHAANLRNLLKQAPLVLVRPLPGWSAALPGLCYLAAGKPTELPVDEAWGGSLIRWQLVGDLVAAPTMNVLVPLWTYGDVKGLWGTYQQAQTALSGKTYLDTLKSPSGV
ncbi:hypothetical protein [Arthrobacter sp. B3I4]|uniref:hypothetical protein n=1 Tax=Arthrobacter sp. B3I4 TaxID=3042267 RepID=UPI00278B689D|nr:hypothetical protein [Arthrobacter sp. B3I4]MDQ0756068.1 hypothetical protein [Arthrobacter sp. B3I4]